MEKSEIKYIPHDYGTFITRVRADLLGKVQDFIMCNDCLFNKPGDPEDCPIKIAYQGLNNVTLTLAPIMECATFKPKNFGVSGSGIPSEVVFGNLKVIQGPPPNKETNLREAAATIEEDELRIHKEFNPEQYPDTEVKGNNE